MYLKISERNGSNRNTVLIPASGLDRLKAVIDEAAQSARSVVSTSVGNNPELYHYFSVSILFVGEFGDLGLPLILTSNPDQFTLAVSLIQRLTKISQPT